MIDHPRASQRGHLLKGRLALVTGSSSGLGLAIGRRLAASGADVVFHGVEPEVDFEPIRSETEQLFGISAHYASVDLRNAEQRLNWLAAIDALPNAVDILVNNAVVRHFAPVEALSMAEWTDALEVNLNSAFALIRKLVVGMKQRNWGRIINVSSIYGLRAAENRADYVTTKTALIGLTRAVALEVATFDITCNALCPGTIRTPAIEHRIRELARAESLGHAQAERMYLRGKQPSGSFIEADRVAALVDFLCSPAAADINGAALPIDAAWSAG